MKVNCLYELKKSVVILSEKNIILKKKSMCQTFCNTKCQKKVDVWLSDFVVIKLRPRILYSVICEEKEKIISDKKKVPRQ